MRSLIPLGSQVHRFRWLIYAFFVITYAGLILLADELHWRLPLKCASLSFVDNGNSLVGLYTVGGARNRNYIFRYDDQLNQNLKFRLPSKHSISCIGFSPDGRTLATSLVRENSTRFEIRSLDNPSKLIKTVDTTAGYHTYDWFDECCLVGNSPSGIVAREWSDTFLVSLSGDVVTKLESFDDHYAPHVEINSSSAYFLKAADCDRKTGLGDIRCFVATPTELELCYHEHTQVFDSRFVASDTGHLVVQEAQRMRIVDMAAKRHRETTFSWLKTDGELQAVSSSGQTLLFCNQQEWIVLSNTGTVLGRIGIEPPYSPQSVRAISDHALVFDRSRSGHQSSSLAMFDWTTSSMKELAFDQMSKTQKFSLDCFSLGLLLSCSGAFLLLAKKLHNTVFGLVVVFAMLSVWVRWVYTLPPDSYYYQDDLRDRILLLVSWQVVLSLVCSIAFRYMPMSIASGITLALAIAIFFSVRKDRSSDYTWTSNLFLISGIGLVVEFICLAFIENRRHRITTAHLLLLMTAIGIAAKLYSDSDGIDLFDPPEPWSPYDTKWPQNIAWFGGISQVVLTIWMYCLAKSKSLWVFIVSPVLLCGLILFLVGPQNIGKGSAPLAMMAATAAGALVSLLILSVVHRFFDLNASDAGSPAAT